MASASVVSLLATPPPSDSITQLKPSFSQFLRHQGSRFFYGNPKKRRRFSFPVARLFRPAIFEASKLKVMFLGVDEEQHPGHLPRTYTVTHSDITAKLTLAISQTINRAQLQGWYNKLQRDEVVAEWKKVQGRMSLHVHCHISGCHFLLDFIAKLRYYIFCKELPVVLKAFIHGDGNLISKHPELEDALVWVYFHSNLQEFNKVECWGPLKAAAEMGAGETREVKEGAVEEEFPPSKWKRPKSCEVPCNCCFPTRSLIPWPQDFEDEESSESLQKQLC